MNKLYLASAALVTALTLAGPASAADVNLSPFIGSGFAWSYLAMDDNVHHDFADTGVRVQDMNNDGRADLVVFHKLPYADITLLFSVARHRAVMEAGLDGIERQRSNQQQQRCRRENGDPDRRRRRRRRATAEGRRSCVRA